MRDSEWMTAEALQGTLGIGRSTFYRRVQSGEIEHAEIGGSRLFRPSVRLSEPSQSVPVPRNGTGQPGTTRDTLSDELGLQDRAELLALVSGYETRIDSLLVERQAATVEAREARERAAALAVELEAERGRSALSNLEAEHARQLAERDREREAAAIEAAKLEAERARLELEHARKLADLEIGNLEALARAKLADAERIAREERQRREGAEAQLAAARALESLPWWRFGQRRQVRALLAN
jgi:hypothetical protein